MKIADRVKETSTTTGTGTLSLAGAASGFEAFMDRFASGDSVFYYIAHQSADEWECGYGTITDATPDTLSRNVIASSNVNALVNFSAGTKDVFCSLPARFVSAHYRALSATATLDDFDRVVSIANTAAATINLPTAVGRAGKQYTIIKTNSENLVTVDANGTETINGETTYTLSVQHACLHLVSDGVNWLIEGGPAERTYEGFVAVADDTPTAILTIPIETHSAVMIEYKAVATEDGGGSGHWWRYAFCERLAGDASVHLDGEIGNNVNGMLTGISAAASGGNVVLTITGNGMNPSQWVCKAAVTKVKR